MLPVQMKYEDMLNNGSCIEENELNILRNTKCKKELIPSPAVVSNECIRG